MVRPRATPRKKAEPGAVLTGSGRRRSAGKRAAAEGNMAGTTPGTGRRRKRGGPTEWTRPEDEKIRWSRVLSAQARIASDFYEREDVKAFLVDAVLEELSRH